MLSHNSKKWCFILSLHRRGASDNEVGDYCDYGDYEDVGTPVVPTRVSFLHLQSLQIVSFYSSLNWCRCQSLVVSGIRGNTTCQLAVVFPLGGIII